MTLNQTASLKPGTSGQAIQQIQQKKIDDLEDKVTELQEAIETLTGIIDNYAASFSTGALQAEKINSPEIDAGNGSGTGQITTDDLTVHDSAHINSLQVDEIDGDLSLDGDLAADNVTASKVNAETVDASNGAGTGSVKTNSLTADTAEIGTLKTSGIDGDLNIAGNTSVTGNASITGGTFTDSVTTKSVTVHNADNTGTVTTDELNVTESARLAEAEIGEINGGLVVNGDIIADGVTTGDITANDITAASATADTVKAKIIAPKDGEEEVRHTASRSQFDHDVYVDGTLYVDTFDIGDLEANHAKFLGPSEEVTADNVGNFTAGKNATIGEDLTVTGDATVQGSVYAGDVNVSKDLAVHGDLYVSGSVTATEEKQVSTSGRYLVTRDNNNSGMASGEHSGIAVNNYTSGKIATCTADKYGTWRVSDSATGTAATYTDMSAYNGGYYEGISQTAKTATLDILTNVDADEMSDVVLYNGDYYKLNGSDWYAVTLTSGALSLGAKVTDSETITALEALTKYPLVYYRTVTSKSIEESQNQPILTRAEESAMSAGQILTWDAINKKAVTALIADLVYPVGSLYWSSNSADPGTLFGGTWTQIKDRFVWAKGDSDTVNATGGSKTVTLTEQQIPSHTHKVTASGTIGNKTASGTISGGSYTFSGTQVTTGNESAHESFSGSASHAHNIYSADTTGGFSTGDVTNANSTYYKGGVGFLANGRSQPSLIERGFYTNTMTKGMPPSSSNTWGNQQIIQNTNVTISGTCTGDHTHKVTASGTISVATNPTFTGTAHNHTFTGTEVTSLATGGGQSHNNMPPYIVKFCWERTA